MDDDQELSFGFGVSHALLSAALEREDANVKVFLKPLVEDYGFERIRARFEFYSARYGQRGDPQQWPDYGDGGKGVALGVSPKFFGLLKGEDFKPEEVTFLGKVDYGEQAAKVRHAAVIDIAISAVKQAHGQGLLLKAEDEEEFLHLLAAEMSVEILWNSVTTKSDMWAHQTETRLLAVNDLKHPKLKIKNREVRPRVEMPQPLLKSSITEVMLGPSATDETKAQVRAFLDDNGLSEVSLNPSAAP